MTTTDVATEPAAPARQSNTSPPLGTAGLRRPTITKLFVASLIALAGGLILTGVAIVLSATTSGLMMRGPDVVGVESSRSGVGIMIVAVLAVILCAAAVVGQFVAWIGALIITGALVDKGWFVVLLLAGLVGFVVPANIAYLVAGPDRIGTAPAAR